MIKVPTGIPGLDAITNGGLPDARVTLLAGGSGTGKTVLALELLVRGARDRGEPAIFVAFEESAERLISNAETFGWDIPALQTDKLLFIDAQPAPRLIQSGTFDLEGLLAGVHAKAAALGARRIVFDAIDVVLALLPDASMARRELMALNDWVLAHNLTTTITMKSSSVSQGLSAELADFTQYLVDCSILLKQEIVEGVSQRSLRVQKYRGTAFEENSTPYIIGPHGFEVAESTTVGQFISTERVSTGIAKLDAMLRGGVLRGSSLLLTGAPGTAKTTLCGAFAAAECARGEKVLLLVLIPTLTRLFEISRP